MTPIQLAEKTWAEAGDGREFHQLPEEYRFKLSETCKEVLDGKSGGIVGLEDFEAKAKEIASAPPEEPSTPAEIAAPVSDEPSTATSTDSEELVS